MSETLTPTIEKTEASATPKLPEGRTGLAIADLVDDQEKPWNYEQLGREETAQEYHEGNYGTVLGLVDQIDEKGGIESPVLKAVRTEIERPASESGESAYRYDISYVQDKQNSVNFTITMSDGRPEMTYYEQPVDTEANPIQNRPDKYRSASWSPEDVAIDYVEQELNEKLADTYSLVSAEAKKAKEAKESSKRTVGRGALSFLRR